MCLKFWRLTGPKKLVYKAIKEGITYKSLGAFQTPTNQTKTAKSRTIFLTSWKAVRSWVEVLSIKQSKKMMPTLLSKLGSLIRIKIWMFLIGIISLEYSIPSLLIKLETLSRLLIGQYLITCWANVLHLNHLFHSKVWVQKPNFSSKKWNKKKKTMWICSIMNN